MDRLKDIAYNLVLNLKNIPGWRTKRKLLVIECDDWGGIRIPSKEVYEKLKEDGIKVPEGHFRYDTLESAEDLEELFHVLNSVKDCKGRRAVMSPMTNIANPCFVKIKESGFREYHYERFTDTLLRYNRGLHTIDLWKQGISEKIFLPQFHGREHISVHFWLKKLQENDKDLLKAFDYEVVSVALPNQKPFLQEFRPAFYFENDKQKQFIIDSIVDGVLVFKDVFGFQPLVFVPSNAIFHPDFNYILAKSGFKYVNVDHLSLTPNKQGGFNRSFRIIGQRAFCDLRYYVRNCAFEPCSDNYKGTDLTLKQIEAAFRWRKPAIISTHRVNFVGGIAKKNREKGLRELKKLLKVIISKWPDAEFQGSSEALDILKMNNLIEKSSLS